MLVILFIRTILGTFMGEYDSVDPISGVVPTILHNPASLDQYSLPVQNQITGQQTIGTTFAVALLPVSQIEIHLDKPNNFIITFLKETDTAYKLYKNALADYRRNQMKEGRK